MKKKVFVLMIIAVSVIAIISTSYGYLRAEKVTDPNSVVVSNFGVVLLTDMTSINMNNLYPMTDQEGLNNQKTTFQIKNTGTITAGYKLSLINKNGIENTLLNSDVRYQLKRTSSLTGTTETLEITSLADNGLIDEGEIEVGETFTYELVMWVDLDVSEPNLTFSKVILVEGSQIASLDTSGANFPEMSENMIPVYYEKTSDTEGVWRKADSKNLNSTYQWFDYNNYMWANAVTVKENGSTPRSNYLTAPLGTEIKMDDITTMWVWIPRYKYTMFTGLNEPSEEQQINVIFEHGIDKTGTVRCVDNILTAVGSASSENCTDTTNGSIIKGKSTYTHPAFTFGDEELTGFWMAKFEMSTDDETCINAKNQTNCNKTDLNILVKPGISALNYQSLSTEFGSIRRMELTNNIHGFPQGDNVTSHLDSNSYLTGEIVNDCNSLDIHMQKNMEWGAVAYLSGSQYGKWSNPLYSGDYRRVYKNNYYISTNYVFKTGYSGGNYNSTQSNTKTYLYNDMTIDSVGQGYRGAGASTTGTVYGIYDMNGGLYDYVMANMVNSSGYFYPSYSGVWATSKSGNIPISKYYDKYSYSTSSDSANSQKRGKLGDATKEVTSTFGLEAGGWGGVNRNMPYSSTSWFNRGGLASYSLDFGVLYSEYVDGDPYMSNGTRPVLVISREFPWLSEQ